MRLLLTFVNSSDPNPRAHRRLKWLLVSLVGVGLAAFLFRKPIQDAVLLRAVLMSDAPSEAAFQELADQSKDPFGLLQKLWDTQKVPHRALVATYLKDNARDQRELLRQAESLLISAASDVDESVRELALAALAQQRHPDLRRLATALLHDADPEMRLLGLQHLRNQEPAAALPAVLHSLDDPDLRVVTSADSALRNWTQQDFGVRINQAMVNPLGDAGADPAHLGIIHQGVRRWNEWWNDHKSEYASERWQAPTAPTHRLPVADFALKDLSDKTVRLSDFKGKVVLLNFWTTWCTGCLAEIPDLIELQKRNPEQFVLLGISLDGQSEVDEHGHPVGRHSEDGHARDGEEEKIDLAQIHAKVEQFVKDKGVSYRVLLDPTSDIGRRFNGGELPANVLIDRQGFARRRFLGGRSPAVSEAMIRELDAKPMY
jgi:thiol-disulfide isomerase/thioredoxin